MKKTVIVGMSGGVDSSVAALLLKKDYNVIGISLQVFDYSEFNDCELKGVCCSPEDIYDARSVASKLSIPFYVLNYKEKFKKAIIENFIWEYINGRTPNPCVLCNELIKFGEMLNFALSIGADYVATGHYAKIESSGSQKLLKIAKDRNKDQSYFLYRLRQRQLDRILFPLGNLTKEEVRKIAKENQLQIYRKRESHEICFVPDRDYAKFIAKNINQDLSGKIIKSDGKILGRHNGYYKFTIGQRRGLNITSDRPLYVKKIDAYKKEVIVGYEDELYSSKFTIKDYNFIYNIQEPDKVNGLMVKIRYLSKPYECKIQILNNDTILVNTLNPIRAITPGQSAVFYLDDIVVGGGTISEVIS